nr:RecName: Full=Rho-GTPase-activating protein [Rattus norvegicus]
LFEENGGAL